VALSSPKMQKSMKWSEMWRIWCLEGKSMKWSGREDLVLGRSFDQLVVLIKMYRSSYGIVTILVSMFGGCREG
jgi:hypothetical protein